MIGQLNYKDNSFINNVYRVATQNPVPTNVVCRFWSLEYKYPVYYYFTIKGKNLCMKVFVMIPLPEGYKVLVFNKYSNKINGTKQEDIKFFMTSRKLLDYLKEKTLQIDGRTYANAIL